MTSEPFRFRRSDGVQFEIRFRREAVYLSDGRNWKPVEGGFSPTVYPGDSVRTHVTLSKMDETKIGKDRYTPVASAMVTRSLKDKNEKRVESYKRVLAKMLRGESNKQFKRTVWETFHRVFNTGIKVETQSVVVAATA